MTRRQQKTTIEYKVYGRFALFSDPITRMGGERSSYQIPTYEALKGITKSIYFKPTFSWIVDAVRVMKTIRTVAKNVKLRVFEEASSELSIFTYLVDAEYQVRAHFEWNENYPEMKQDRIVEKHLAVAQRMIEKGGRRDVCLGTRECQGDVEPCVFGEGSGDYDDVPELDFGLMFHGFTYPDEYPDPDAPPAKKNCLYANFWKPVMRKGILTFPRPEACPFSRAVRPMIPKRPRSRGLGNDTLN